MSGMVVGLGLAYAALAALVVLFLAYTRWPLWVKVSVVLAISGFYFVTYVSLERILGWPTTASLPQEFLVYSGIVREPAENAGEDGGIYLWVAAYDMNNRRVLDVPRAHALPYSADLHQQVATANKRLQRGYPQVGRVEMIAGPRLGAPRSWVDERVARILLYDFPQQELPEK